MLKNYVVIAIRNLLRHKGYSAINILGLAVGMACCILVGLFIQDEFQYDTFHKDSDRIYRILSDNRTQIDQPNIHSGTSGPLAPAMAEAYPQIDSYMRVFMDYSSVWFHTQKHIGIEKYFLTDPHFFEFFSFPLVQGDKETVLNRPFTAVISETMAEKYFGDQQAIGQTITIDTEAYAGIFRVTGIMKDVPTQSSLQMDFVTATAPQGGEAHRVWNIPWLEFAHWRPIQTYIRLKPDASPKDIESKLPRLVLRHTQVGPEARLIYKANPQIKYFLQPLARMRLYSNADYGLSAPATAQQATRRLYGDIQNIHILSAIALFVLAIACMNFMNLTTARSVGRAREVGLRKVVGADRKGLIQQFLGESALVSLLALIIAIFLAILALPTFNGFVGKSLSLYDGNIVWFAGLCLCAVLVGVSAGSYPAFFLSSFQPVAVLKGAFQSRGHGALVRKSLVVLQFSISILLIISTVIVHRQLTYMQNKPLGFEKEHVILLPIFSQQRRTVTQDSDRLIYRHGTVTQEFLKHPNVEAATLSRIRPGQSPGFARMVQPQGIDHSTRLFFHSIDEKFIDFFDIELVAGRNFEPEDMFTRRSYIVNEAAVKAFGWTDPLGKQIHRNGGIGTVIGVIKDFHNNSLHSKIEPAAFIPIHSLMAHLVLRVQADRFPDTVDFLDKTWKQFLPSRPLQFEFLDQTLDRAYQAERRMAKSTGAFSLIAIGLACLGLFGLAAFTTEQRTKEIGVRKVLGASVSHVIFILSKEFARLVLIANLIAWPIAYYGLNEWLQTFAYRTALGIDAFILGGGLAILIALLTVSTLAIRASRSNPINALRYE